MKKVSYLVTIKSPETHIVEVKLRFTRPSSEKELEIFFPSWSPGSYLMREYSRHMRNLKVEDSKGRIIHYLQRSNNTWALDFSKDEGLEPDLLVSYEVYAHELTVRTSHVDAEHAYLHGPSLFMGVRGLEKLPYECELSFPPSWSKVTTGLKDISKKRESFLYAADNYDILLDGPFEIGCQETDGFISAGKPHEIAFYGVGLGADGGFNMKLRKKEMEIIVKHISETMGEMPYEKYTFMTHLLPGLYGGLEHLNSTSLQFDPYDLETRAGHLNWLSLVAHEYFHTWNVKRIRPKGLGPFDYTKELNTELLWLAEGLTSFVDELFILQCGLSSLDEYLTIQVKNINQYLFCRGRKFDSLDMSSFNAWIKLYRPHENSKNSTISYYLKGGFAFMVLHCELLAAGKNINDFLAMLWSHYKKDPEVGIEKGEIFDMIESLGGGEVRELFEVLVSTTEDIDFEKHLGKIGLHLEWDEKRSLAFQLIPEDQQGRLFIKSVTMDGAAHKQGLCAGDEIIAIDGARILFGRYTMFESGLKGSQLYEFTLSRQGKLVTVKARAELDERKLKAIKYKSEKKVLQNFLVK